MKYQVMPDLTPVEFEALKADIAQNGVLVPVEVDEDGNTLDGHHRIRAWQELKAEGRQLPDYPFILRPGLTEEQKRNHARRLNIHRRHLTKEQRNDLIVDMRQDGMSNRQIGKAIGVNEKTVRNVTAGAEYSAPANVTGADGKQYPATMPDRKRGDNQPSFFGSVHNVTNGDESPVTAADLREWEMEDDIEHLWSDCRQCKFYHTVKFDGQYETICGATGSHIEAVIEYGTGLPPCYDYDTDTLLKHEPEDWRVYSSARKKTRTFTNHNDHEDFSPVPGIIGTGEDGMRKAAKLTDYANGGGMVTVDSAEDARTEEARTARRQERTERIQEIAKGNTPLTSGLDRQYPVIYLDPPWQYEHSKNDNRVIENHYPTMALDELKALPVPEIAAPDCVMFMWVTSPKLTEAVALLNAWGFTYRTNIVWDKERMGMGYYARQQHELLFIAARGSLPVPLPENRIASVVRLRRDNQHSAKPSDFYEIIERMYPEYDKVELFARVQRDGWASWGNEANK